MNYVQKMIMSHPKTITDSAKRDLLTNCIGVCYDCAQACVICSDACLGEQKIESLRETIKSTADCADICNSTGRVLSRLNNPDWNVIQSQVNACINSVRQCGMSCNEHRHHHEHCAICADSCRACESACSEYLKQLS
jgi:hypothetical protein